MREHNNSICCWVVSFDNNNLTKPQDCVYDLHLVCAFTSEVKKYVVHAFSQALLHIIIVITAQNLIIVYTATFMQTL